MLEDCAIKPKLKLDGRGGATGERVTRKRRRKGVYKVLCFPPLFFSLDVEVLESFTEGDVCMRSVHIKSPTQHVSRLPLKHST